MPSPLPKKQITQQYSSNNPHQIRQQHGAYGVAGIFDIYGTEVNGHYIKGGIGGALKNSGEPAGE